MMNVSPGPGDGAAVSGTPEPVEARADPASAEVLSSQLVAVPERPSPAASPDLRGDDPWAEAGRKLFRFHLARVLARVPGVLAGKDPEEVHAMRVAARRMRATWRVFGDGFEREARRRYLGELRAIGSSLGTVRDLDVLLQILVAYGEDASTRQRAGLEPLHAAWSAERAERHEELVAILGSERFTEFADDYASFVDTPGLAAGAIPAHAPDLVRNRMPSRLWEAYQEVWAFDGDLAAADLATLHELRIAAKWLRYTLEFVREPLDPAATALIRPIVTLQDDLGVQRDWHTAAERARGYVATASPGRAEAKAIGRLTRTLDDGVERRRQAIARSWRPVVAPRYRRALGRAVARL